MLVLLRGVMLIHSLQAESVSVNGKIVTELGVRVMPSDDVRYNGSNVKREVLQYFLMNKPKDYICTTDDPVWTLKR